MDLQDKKIEMVSILSNLLEKDLEEELAGMNVLNHTEDEKILVLDIYLSRMINEAYEGMGIKHEDGDVYLSTVGIEDRIDVFKSIYLPVYEDTMEHFNSSLQPLLDENDLPTATLVRYIKTVLDKDNIFKLDIEVSDDVIEAMSETLLEVIVEQDLSSEDTEDENYMTLVFKVSSFKGYVDTVFNVTIDDDTTDYMLKIFSKLENFPNKLLTKYIDMVLKANDSGFSAKSLMLITIFTYIYNRDINVIEALENLKREVSERGEVLGLQSPANAFKELIEAYTAEFVSIEKELGIVSPYDD